MGRRQVAEAASKKKCVFYVRTGRTDQKHRIYKLPLLCKSDSASSPAFSLKRCSNKPSSPAFSLKRCRNRRRPRISRPYCLGRFRRYTMLRTSLLRLDRFLEPPSMPRPYVCFHCTGLPGDLPEEAAMAALGSKIYFIGGSVTGTLLPTDVYAIDTANPDPPEIVKTASRLQSGKRSPVAWTIGGKIYVMPKTFISGESLGHFECFDPNSDSWTILQSPPFVNDMSKFTIPLEPEPSIDPCDSSLLLVKSNAVLGSSLIISTHEGSIYRFDTAEPDKGWSSVTLEFGSEKLKFLPFDTRASVSIQQDLVFSHLDWVCFQQPDLHCVPNFSRNDRLDDEPYIGHSVEERMFLKTQCGILPGDSYVCRFEASGSSTLKLSVKKVKIPMGREEFMDLNQAAVARIRDGVVLFVGRGKAGLYGDQTCSFNVVRIESVSDEFVASNLSSVFLTPDRLGDYYKCSFYMNHHTFTTGWSI